MTDEAAKLKFQDREEVFSTGDRRRIADVLARSFADLDPAKKASSVVKSIIGGRNVKGRLFVIGFGKASLKMYEGIRNHTRGLASYSGLIIPEGESVDIDFPELEILRGNHPIPGGDTRESSLKLLNNIEGHDEKDLIIVLISGGGSALFEIPDEGFTVEGIGKTAKCLMGAGADIHELNTVRHAMSKVKGGKLAGILWPSKVISLVISDVPGDDLQIIASGPLVQPGDESGKLSAVIRKYSGVCEDLEALVTKEEFSVPDPMWFENVQTEMILKNSDFVGEISSLLSRSGNEVITLEDPVTGDVEDVSERIVNMARERYSKLRKPFWIVGGGETTARVVGNGSGGRNCELSVRVAVKMRGDEKFTFSSIGTDGIDGASPAMGGLTDDTFKSRTTQEEIDRSLSFSDSYSLLNKYSSAIVTGYTGTNVSDIFILHYAGKGN